MDKIIYGADSETLRGKPMTLQFYSEDVACSDLFFVNEKTAARTFFKWCDKRQKKCTHVVYLHYLAFDLIELLWGFHDKLASPGGDFSFRVGNWFVRGVYGAPTFAQLSDGNHTTIFLLDSFSYFRGSLAAAATLFCPDLPKLKRVENLGERQFKKSDTRFCEYAMRDPEICYHIGKSIEALHQQYDLRQCVSVADMAATIFRHRFLTYTIPQPPRDIIEAALLSYHGGKNNVTVKAGWYPDVSSLDIKSAYPHAMHGLPSFSNEKLYRRLRAGRGCRSVPDLGVYSVSGRVASCDWPSVFSHGFKPLSGAIDRVYIQGFELNEALRSGELKASRITGWMYDAEKDHQAPALRAFIDDFFARKESEKDPILRYMYKLILNSISGKFIQTRKAGTCAYTDIDADVTVNASELVAGGMFHPFIASAITAHTRSRIHRLEHHYQALHTATDGIFTQRASLSKKASRDSGLCIGGKGLGALTVEHTGELMLVRNKCYILYAPDGEIKSWAFKDKRIAKHALHGFQGSVHDLEKLIATGRRKYSVTRPWRLKQALKGGHTPNEFVERSYTLKIGLLDVHVR